MRRRDFLTLAGAAAAFPGVAFAQQARVPRVAWVNTALAATDLTLTGSASTVAFLQEMVRLGYVEGKTVFFERYGSSSATASQLANLILTSSPDIVFFSGSSNVASALMPLTKTLPMVVVASVLDVGLVDNAAHPGGNITGVSPTGSPDEEGKNLELLAQCVPGARRVACYTSGVGGVPTPGTINELAVQASAAAAARLALSFTDVIVETPANDAEYRRAFAVALSTHPDMIQFGRGNAVSVGVELLAKLALDARMPAIAPYGAFASAGGLISYGSNSIDYNRKAASYVAQILQGARAGDLPVLQPTVFDLIVNLKTAKAIGVTIPASLLAQATEVIQ